MSVAAWLAVAACACAAPGLWWFDRSPRLARAAAAVALLCLVAAVLDPAVREPHEVPPRLRVVTTGPAESPELTALRARWAAAPGAELETTPARGGVGTTLVAAALESAAPLGLVWTGAIDRDEPVAAGLAGDAWTAVAPGALEPDAFELRVLGAAEVGRPLLVELRRSRGGVLPAGTAVELAIADPSGAVVAAAAEPGALERPLVLEHVPAAAGRHRVSVRARAGAELVEGTGAVTVSGAPRVLVVGEGAGALVPALVAQGVAADAAATLPAELAHGVVVALDPLPAAAQERLRAWVDAGGGLLLVGGAEGGGLPPVSEPLATFSPVTYRPAPRPDRAAGQDGGPEPGDDAQARPEAPERPAEERPRPDELATGDTAGASPPDPVARTVERRSIALLLVVDRSASMGELVARGWTRMQYAKRAAFETATRLRPGDELGIVAFGSGAGVVRPLGPLPAEPELREVLERLRETDGATELHDGLEAARVEMVRSALGVRHVVVVTDGDFADFISQMPRSYGIAQRMASAGVTTSVIHIGADSLYSSSSLAARRVAAYGAGQYHAAADPTKVPALLLAEVRRVLGGGEADPAAGPGADSEPRRDPGAAPPDAGPVAGPETPPVRPSEPVATEDPAAPAELEVIAVADSLLLEPLPPGGFPPVHGICPAEARAAARTLLVAGDAGTPLLAFANRGLGRVGAWTADLIGAWGRSWREDPAFPARLATWVEHLRPPAAEVPGAIPLELRHEPAMPMRHDRDWVRRTLGAELRGLDEAAPGPATREVVVRGAAVDLAWVGAVALLLLALVEYVMLRRS